MIRESKGPLLTRRERQICDLLVHGLTNKEIGLKLDISHRTVEDFRPIIFRKLKVRNAVELVLRVHRLGKFSEATA